MRNKKLAWLSVLTVSSIATPMLAAACNETKDYNQLVNVKLKDQASNKLAKDVTADDIDVSSTDKTLKLKVTSVNVSATDKNSVTVIIQVKDPSSKKPHTITKILKGFKTEKGRNNSNEGETKDYNQLVNVKLKDQAANKLAKDVTADDIEVSSTDKTLELKVTSVKVSATDKDSVTVIIQVKDPSSKKTHTITKVLKGFKTEKGQSNSNEGGANNDSGQGDQRPPQHRPGDSTPNPQPDPKKPGDSKPDDTSQSGPGNSTPNPQPDPKKPGDSKPDDTSQQGPGDEKPKKPNDGTDNDSGSENKIDPVVEEAYDIFSKHTKLSKSKKSWEFLSKANDGDPIYYDIKQKAFYAEKFDKKNRDKERTLLFKLEDGYTPGSGLNAAWPDDENNSSETNVPRVKLIKRGDKFGFKFRVAKFKSGKLTFPNPKIVKETELQEFNVPSEADVQGVLDSIENLNYENKENIEEKDAIDKDKVQLPKPDGYTVHVESITPVVGQRKILVVIYLSYNIGDDVVYSNKRTVEITGFKNNDLTTKIKDVKIVYDGNKLDKLPSQVENSELKAKLMDKDLDSSIEVSYSLKADDYKGILHIKATFSQANESTEISYEIGGFKKLEFNLDEFINKYPKPTLSSGVDKSKTEAIKVGVDKFTLSHIDPGIPVTVAIKSVTVDDNDNTKLKLTVLFTNTLDNTTKEKTYEFDGFKPAKTYRNPQAFKLAEKGDLFKFIGTEDDKKEILDYIEHFNGKEALLDVGLDGIILYNKDIKPKSVKKSKPKKPSKKNKKRPVRGLSLVENAKGIIYSHGGTNNTVAPAFIESGKKQGSKKGVSLVKTDTSVEIQFKLVLDGKDGVVDDKVYSFKLFDLKSDTSSPSQPNSGDSSRSHDEDAA